MMLPHLAARLYGTPLLIQPAKLEVILSVLGERIGLPKMAIPNFVPPPRNIQLQPGVAVIPIYGTLVKRTLGLEAESGLTSYQSIADQLDAAMADPSITAILLDIDSGGGEVSGCFDLADRIAACKDKRVWAIANDNAFSAAYALASAAQRAIVTRTSGVGSIGVIAMHVDQSQQDAQDGLTYTAITAGAHKNDLSPHQPMTDAARAGLQTEVDRLYGLFVDTVARNRNLSPQSVRDTEAGLYFGSDAVSAGLADAMGTFDDVLNELLDVSTRPALPGFFMKETLMKGEAHVSPDPVATDLPVRDADVQSTQLRGVSQGLQPELPPTPTLSAATEIAELCTLAGCPERIAAYLEAQATPAQVRQALLSARAQSVAPITSLISPEHSAPQVDGTLVQVIKQRLEAQKGVSK